MNQRESSIFDHPQKKAQLFVFVGKSLKGKSHFIKWLLYDRFTNANWQFGLTFCVTKFNGDYKFLPDNRVIEGYNEGVLQKYIQNLQKKIRNEGKESVPPNFVLFDDLTGVLDNNTDWFVNLIATHRHTNTNLIFATQYLTGKKAISPIIREQTSFAIMFRSMTARTKTTLYENFGQLFPNQAAFEETLERITSQPYHALLYMESQDKLEENYLDVIAPEVLPTFSLKF